MAISSAVAMEEEEDLVAATFLGQGMGIPEAPVAWKGREVTTLLTAGW